MGCFAPDFFIWQGPLRTSTLPFQAQGLDGKVEELRRPSEKVFTAYVSTIVCYCYSLSLNRDVSSRAFYFTDRQLISSFFESKNELIKLASGASVEGLEC